MVSIQAPQIQVSDAGGLPFKGIARYGKVQCMNVYTVVVQGCWPPASGFLKVKSALID